MKANRKENSYKSSLSLSLSLSLLECLYVTLLINSSLTVKAATLIFITGRGSAILSAKQGKSGSIYNLVKS